MDMLETPDKDLPLRDDIRLLGRILGDTVRSQEGEPVFAIVERIRRTSIRFHRDEDEAARHELEATLNSLSHGQSIQIIREVAAAYPNLKVVASTLRTAHTATRNAWGAIALYNDEIVHVPQRDVEIYDRVGGGDSFASGLIYGFLAAKSFEWAVMETTRLSEAAREPC